jgi:hypothetical protein
MPNAEQLVKVVAAGRGALSARALKAAGISFLAFENPQHIAFHMHKKKLHSQPGAINTHIKIYQYILKNLTY